MALYSIESEQCLGISHSGAVTVNGESAVELSDEDVEILVKLIKEKGTTDVEELNLENLHPTIYKKLDEAYYDMAYKAEEMHWLWEGYYGSYFEYDEDKLKEYCKANCGFSYVFNKEENGYDEDEEVDEYMIEDAENEAFSEWLDEYVEGLSDDEVRDFFYNHMDADLDMDNVEYTVEIPQAIINKALDAKQ